MARRSVPFRVLAVVVFVWVFGLAGARDQLHNHSGMTERPDCPACRLDGTVGVTGSTTAALVAIPDLRPLGVVCDARSAGVPSGAFALEPPPRSPPLPL